MKTVAIQIFGTDTLEEKMSLYAEVKVWLYDFQAKHFPRNCFVKVNNPRYHGFGMFVGGCNEPDKITVKLPNGNDWWYELNTCEVVTDLRLVPQEMRRIKMRYRGLKVLVGYGPRRALP